MENENYFGSSNFWLGVVIVFLMLLVGYLSWATVNEDSVIKNQEDQTTYIMLFVAGCILFTAASIIACLVARKEAEFKGRSENLLRMQNQIQKDIMLRGKPELLESWLIHDDELEFAVKLDDTEMSRTFFKMYEEHCTQEAKVKMWFLAVKIGNLPVIQEIVDSNIIPDLNVKDEDSNTAAHIAVIYSQSEILDYFKKLHLQGKMNLGIRNNQGKVPFDLYPETHKKIVDIFADVESDPTDNVSENTVVEREINEML